MIKILIRWRLECWVKKYFTKHPEVKLVAITGSVGKTSTKMAIATVLSQSLKVRVHEGNHNSDISAPLAMLGVKYPDNVHSLKQWLLVFKAIKKRIAMPSDVDVIIQELGSDHPGEIKHFGKYLKPDIGVVTAVSPEHMEFFNSLDEVAREELKLANFSKQALINRDDINGKYAKYLKNSNIDTYGLTATAEYYFTVKNFNLKSGHDVSLSAPNLDKAISAKVKVLGEHNLRPAVAAAAVALRLDVSNEDIVKGLSLIRPVSGRMNILQGIKDSLIIDDTYNSSPLAVKSALKTLYQLDAPQKIAVLGSMNELGKTSAVEHEKVGELCDPNQLAWLVTVGVEANEHLAPIAKSKGCQVKTFKNAILAGAFVHSVIEKNAAILYKGSQGGIFLEEAIKISLKHHDDEAKLVRQSDDWLDEKAKFFKSH